MKNSFSHLNDSGEAHMVNVGIKPVQHRSATATAYLACQPETIALLRQQALPKGDVLGVARVAGILAAKKTHEWIPLCHSLPIEQIRIEFEVESNGIRIIANTQTFAKTGIEMESLTAVSAAGLTLYDMMKAVDKTMVLGDIRVTEKLKQ